jgi:hypothetical protein
LSSEPAQATAAVPCAAAGEVELVVVTELDELDPQAAKSAAIEIRAKDLNSRVLDVRTALMGLTLIAASGPVHKQVELTQTDPLAATLPLHHQRPPVKTARPARSHWAGD